MAAAPDHYAVLGVTPEADEAVIRAAWRALVRKYHPDHAGDAADAAERTRAVNQAWAALGDPNRRIAYDLERAAQPLDDGARTPWSDAPYPVPPRRGLGTTALLIAAFVGLPLAALTLPGVPGQVAAMLPGDGSRAAGFARASLKQVRRLLSPTQLGTPETPRRSPTPMPGGPPVDAQHVERAASQYGRTSRRLGTMGVTAYGAACAQRAATLATWEAQDFCAAFDLAAGLSVDRAARGYARLGANPPGVADRLGRIQAILRQD